MSSPLKLFWARGTGGAEGIRNAGDWYSPMICERLSGRPVVYAPPNSCDLVAVGSLLQRLNKSHRLHRLGFRRKLHLWGTGSLRAQDELGGTHYIHAVRGALTRARIGNGTSGAALGEPGLLADRLLETVPAKRHSVGVIPHLVDQNDPAVLEYLERQRDAHLIDLKWPVLDVLQAIASCERILSSSLHGLAFADAFEVPNAWFSVSDRLVGGRHKFDDYYSAFGLDVNPASLADVDLTAVADHYSRPGLAAVKEGLVRSFPGT